ncbi:hypothetical protein Asera_56330 [Actinocatenispora sera]|uniref:Uncharacterized protein n=1 Tax=Actinocatenispora sera TaxID=390989 RepID=A0A810L9G1_9ACTN|nr:hypothetical protein Asera_56330 [Actinocatenispora sera]
MASPSGGNSEYLIGRSRGLVASVSAGNTIVTLMSGEGTHRMWRFPAAAVRTVRRYRAGFAAAGRPGLPLAGRDGRAAPDPVRPYGASSAPTPTRICRSPDASPLGDAW